MNKKLEKQIGCYRELLEYKKLKIVMKSEIFDKLSKEVETDYKVYSSDDKIIEFMGCPIEINDKIMVDYYLCEQLD